MVGQQHDSIMIRVQGADLGARFHDCQALHCNRVDFGRNMKSHIGNVFPRVSSCVPPKGLISRGNWMCGSQRYLGIVFCRSASESETGVKRRMPSVDDSQFTAVNRADRPTDRPTTRAGCNVPSVKRGCHCFFPYRCLYGVVQ